MALIVRGGNLLVNSSGQPIDCSTCTVCGSEACTTSCDEGICCHDAPAEVLVTVPTGTFGSSLCSTGGCTDVEGLQVMTQAAFPTTCLFTVRVSSNNCGPGLSCSETTVSTPAVVYDWEMRFIATNTVRVIMRQADVISTGPPVTCANFADTYFHGTLPAASSLFDCSLSTPITCAFTSQDVVAGSSEDGCRVTSTNVTVTVEAN
jgi:hypothetical protein